MGGDIVSFCAKNGFLLDQNLISLLNKCSDLEILKLFLQKLKFNFQTGFLSLEILKKNPEKLKRAYFEISPEERKKIVFLEESFDFFKESSNNKIVVPITKNISEVSVLKNYPSLYKKVEVKDFVIHFKNRFNNIQNVLRGNPQLTNLTSINKISGNQQGISIIGMITEKQTTKNKNIIFTVEDLTGSIKVLINQNKEELYALANEISLDSVLGFKGSGNDKIFFVNEVIFPDSFLPTRKKSPVEEYALFTADLHYGSKLFLKKSFNKFLDYLCGKLPNTPEVSKIKYLFLVGDVVSGVGNYPDQENDLDIVDLEDQFLALAKDLDKIPKSIKIIISPGNHDGVRLMEPQPMFDEKYAWPLYQMENVILTGNPAVINIGKCEGFSGFNILTYHGFSFQYYANNVQSLMKIKAMNVPDKIMHYLLKCRHLAPTHGSCQYFPSEEDFYFIDPIPDIFVSGHTHKSEVSYYNNILVISTSCWEAMTSYQEKMGSSPDHCKVPLFNLKTRAVKILDFEDEQDRKVCND